MKKIVLACAAFLLTMGIAIPSQAEDVVYIPLHNTGFEGAKKMPPVSFSHDRHSAFVEEKLEKDCTLCHTAEMDQYMDVASVASADKMDYMHKNCLSCHEEQDKGPRIGDCRSCHSASNAARLSH